MGFEALYGNEPAKTSLQKALGSGRIANAYVFCGKSGVGKRLLADLFARALVCEGAGKARPCDQCSACIKARSKNHPDIVSLTKSAARASIGVDDIREQILQEVYLKPYLADRRVFIIEDGDILSVEAQNALLKILEEPPSYVTFILLVTEKDKLLDTVLSRSQLISFFPLAVSEVCAYLKETYGDNENNEMIARLSQGSIGTAVALLKDEAKMALFEKSVQHMLRLKGSAVSVREMVDFLLDERENIQEITDFLLTFLRDCVFLLSGASNHLIYVSKASQMRVFIKDISKKSLVKAFDRLTDLKLRLKQNLNYNAAVFETVMRVWEDFHDKGSGHSV